MRFYFDISDGLPIRDQVGRDFRLVSDAVVYANIWRPTCAAWNPISDPSYRSG
jgi:hypothetical protein